MTFKAAQPSTSDKRKIVLGIIAGIVLICLSTTGFFVSRRLLDNLYVVNFMCLPVLIIVFLFGLVIFFGLLFRIREYEVTETEIIVRSGFGKLRRYRLSDYVDVVRVTRDLELTGEQIQESIEIDKGKKTFRRNRRGSVYRTPELGVFEHEITSTSGQYLVLVKASGKNSLLVSPEDSSSFASTIKAYLKRTSR